MNEKMKKALIAYLQQKEDAGAPNPDPKHEAEESEEQEAAEHATGKEIQEGEEANEVEESDESMEQTPEEANTEPKVPSRKGGLFNLKR